MRFVSLFRFSLFITCCTFVAIAGSDALCDDKDAGPVAKADQLNSFELMTASADVLRKGRTEDAGYLFLAAQMRFEIDKQVYPPVETGADSPDVLQSALSFSIGSGISAAMSQDPAARTKATKRLTAWTPTFGPKYDPGWKYKNPLQGEAIAPIVAATRKKLLAPLEKAAKLEKDPDYARLTQDLAAANRAILRIEAESDPRNGKKLTEAKIEAMRAEMNKRSAIAEKMKEIEWRQIPSSRWHAQVGWKAEDYFQDPQVIALCHAIEIDDVKAMERLITAGADAKAIGKDGMTPLLWAFPDRKLDRFACLLRNGADPNVVFGSDFGVPKSKPFHPNAGGHVWLADRGCAAGQSVTYLACRSPVTEYMRQVFANRGDANLVDKETGDSPLTTVLDNGMPDMQERVEILLKLKADPNHFSRWHGGYPAMLAVHANRFDIALALLAAGADPTLAKERNDWKLIDVVARADRNLQYFPNEKVAQYQALVDELERRGESLKEAKERAEAKNK